MSKLSDRERARAMVEKVRQVADVRFEKADDCSVYYSAAADATAAAISALSAGAYEKASGAFAEAIVHLDAGHACDIAQKALADPVIE